MLDYDDIIYRTAKLLTQPGASGWVQYKLDQGIGHILIDEAQDTNPAQWSIIKALREEFFAGETARNQTARCLPWAMKNSRSTLFRARDRKYSAKPEQKREGARGEICSTKRG